jgi:hypothetical protein
MKDIKTLLAAIAAKQGEINELEAAIEEASRNIKSAALEPGFEKEIPRLRERAADVQLLPLRLKKLNDDLGRLEEAMIPALRHWVNIWNGFIAAKMDSKFDEFIEAMLPFHGGREAEKSVRRRFENLHIPAVHGLRSAIVDLGNCHQVSPEIRVQIAERVIQHCESWWQCLGFKLPVVIEDAPASRTRTGTPKPKCRKTIHVRVKEDVTIPALVEYHKKQREHPERFREGELLEISIRHYYTLSRFFELLDEPLIPEEMQAARFCLTKSAPIEAAAITAQSTTHEART